MKSGNGNEKAEITTFEFSASRRQYRLIRYRNRILRSECAEGQISSARAEILGRGHVATCTNQQYVAQIWRIWAQHLHFCSAGAADEQVFPHGGDLWDEKEGNV